MKKVLEKDIQRDICDWLASLDLFFWRQNTVPVFAMSGSGYKRFRAMPKYTPRGLPDIILLWEGHFIGLEVKRPGERGGNPVSVKSQIFMAGKIIENGGYYKIVHSLDEAKLYLSLIMETKNETSKQL